MSEYAQRFTDLSVLSHITGSGLVSCSVIGGRRSRGAPSHGNVWMILLMYGLGNRRFSATTGQDLVSCRRSAQKLLAPLGIVDNNSSESPPVFIYQTIAAAWNAERSMERTGAAGLLNDEGHPKRKFGTQRPLPHGA